MLITSASIFFGYRPFIISTIVDILSRQGLHPVGYRPFIISTIVDRLTLRYEIKGYRPFIISTIVDLIGNLFDFLGAIGLL